MDLRHLLLEDGREVRCRHFQRHHAQKLATDFLGDQILSFTSEIAARAQRFDDRRLSCRCPDPFDLFQSLFQLRIGNLLIDRVHRLNERRFREP